MNLNIRLHECDQSLNDGELLVVLSGGSAIAQLLKYHCVYLSDLYNRERSHLRGLEKELSQNQTEPDIFPLVLSKLVSYTVETSLCSDGPAIIHLVDMSKLCQ